MASLNFPDNPANGEIFTVGNKKWQFSTTTNSWTSINSIIVGATGATGFTGATGVGATGDIGATGATGPINTNIPQNSQTTGYTLQLSDAGKHVSITTGNVTVPASVFSAGDVVTVYNNSTSNQIIIQGSGVTMYLVGTSTTGNRTIAQRGLGTVLCVSANTFVCTGGGIS